MEKQIRLHVINRGWERVRDNLFRCGVQVRGCHLAVLLGRFIALTTQLIIIKKSLGEETFHCLGRYESDLISLLYGHCKLHGLHYGATVFTQFPSSGLLYCYDGFNVSETNDTLQKYGTVTLTRE